MASLNLREIFPDLADLTEEEIIMIQESTLNEMQKNRSMGRVGGRGSRWSSVQEFDNQLAADEALARALERGDDLTDYELTRYRTTTTRQVGGQGSWNHNSSIDEDEALARALAADLEISGHGPPHQGTPVTGGTRNIRGDDIDPDRMTYEELNSLGDSVGKESKGLPVESISRLPIFTHKAGARSSTKPKDEKDECVVCRTEYENGDKLTALPCAHRFHSDCITPWLKDNKNCPICQKEAQ